MGGNPKRASKRSTTPGEATKRLLRAGVESLDAARHVPDGGSDSSSLGNLSVPLSVWPIGTERPALVAEVVNGFSTSGDLVVVALTGGGGRVAAAGRRAVIMCHHRDTTAVQAELAEIDATRRALARVQNVTNENLSSRLAGLAGKLDLLIASDAVRWCEGFWSAVAHTLRPGGHIAVVSTTADAAVHAKINDAAASAGLTYVQHVLACSRESLDDAVTFAATPPRRNPGLTHSRAHLDVFVYARPADRRVTAGGGS